MTDDTTSAVKLEVAHGGDPQAKTSAIKAEVAHRGVPVGKTSAVKAEVAHRGAPTGRALAVKLEVAYSLRPEIVGWPVGTLWEPGAHAPMTATPIAGPHTFPIYPRDGDLTSNGGTSVSFGGIGATQDQGTFDTRAFSDFTAVGAPPADFTIVGSSTAAFTAVPTSYAFSMAGAAVVDLKGNVLAPGVLSVAGAASVSFGGQVAAEGMFEAAGEAVMRGYITALKPMTLSAPGLATVTFAGRGAILAFATMSGAGVASFASRSTAQTYWRSNAYAVADFRESHAIGGRMVSTGNANAFFANGSVRPTTLTSAGAASVAFGGSPAQFEFGANGSSTVVFYSYGAGVGVWGATGAADAEFAGATRTNVLTAAGAASVAWAGARALDTVWSASGAGTADFASYAPGLGVLRTTGAATVDFIGGQPIRSGALAASGSAVAHFRTTSRFVMAGASTATFASDMSWAANWSVTGVGTADFESLGAVTTTFQMAGGSSFTASPLVALQAAGGSSVAFRGATPVYGTLNASGGAVVLVVGQAYVAGVAAAVGAATVAFAGAAAITAGVEATGAADVEFAGGGLASAVSHADAASSATFRGRALAIGVGRANGLSNAQFVAQALAKGVLTAAGGSAASLRSAREIAATLTAAGGSNMAARSNVGIAGALTVNASATGSFVGSGTVYSQFYATGKATFTAIFGERKPAAWICDGSSTVNFQSSAIKQSAFTAVGYAVVVGYTDASMVLNPGKVEVTWSSADAAATWKPTATSDVVIEQQAAVEGLVTRQGAATASWEL